MVKGFLKGYCVNLFCKSGLDWTSPSGGQHRVCHENKQAALVRLFGPLRVRSITNANKHCKPTDRLIFSIPDRGSEPPWTKSNSALTAS